MSALAVLLVAPLLLSSEGPVHEEEPDWIQLSASVLPTLELEHGNWMDRTREYVGEVPVSIRARLVSSNVLEVSVSDHDGFSGDTLVFRLSADAEARLTVVARGSFRGDAGPVRGGIDDLHGMVQASSRLQEGESQILLTWKLEGLRVYSHDSVHPMRTEGEVAVPMGDLDWELPFPEPAGNLPRGLFSAAELEELRRLAPDGTLRAQGNVDRTGRRQGAWATWWPNGAKQVEATYVDGQRHGLWMCWRADGRLEKVGRFENALEAGSWAEFGWSFDEPAEERGTYVEGMKEGVWVRRWSDGTPLARTTYVQGSRQGPFAVWWPNGSKRIEGVHHGLFREEWTTWDEDGNLLEVWPPSKEPR